MPELLDVDHDRKLAPGDVVMVSRKVKPKDGGKPFVWKFFLVVTEHDVWDDRLQGWVVGATGKLKDTTLILAIDQERNIVHFLPEDEWPDGVRIFRLSMILKGRIEDL